METNPETTQSVIGSATIETTIEPNTPHNIPDPVAPVSGAVEPPVAGTALLAEAVLAIALADLTVPDGVLLEADGAAIPEAESFLTLINEHKIPKDAANALLDLYPKLLQRAADAHAAQWETTQSDWQEKLRSDPDFGGAKLPSSLSSIAKVLDKYGDAASREALSITGAGNHPAIFRLLAKIAADLNEAPPVSGTPVASSIPRSQAERIFGKTGT